MADYRYYDLVTTQGVIVPDTADVRADLEAEYKQVFGAELDVTPETPQGRLIEADTMSRMDTIRLNALMANQINPNVATGTFLDAIAALTDCYRNPATQSSVLATLTSSAGTVIPAGSTAKTTADDIFYLENSVTLPVSGSAQGTFLSQDTGPVPAPAGSLITIVDGVIGWETITNDSAAQLGSNVESDRDLRLKRRRTLFTGAGYIGAVESALWRVDNVQGVLVKQNDTGAAVTDDNVTLAAHSIYACVYGGSDTDIALALYKVKTVGAAYNGNTSVTINDPVNGRPYVVKFQRPTVVQIQVEIDGVVTSPIGDLHSAILQAINDYQFGNIANVEGLNVGTDVSPFEMSAAIATQVQGIFITNIKIARVGGTPASGVVEIFANEIARISGVNVVINLE